MLYLALRQVLNLILSFFVLTIFTFSLAKAFPDGVSFIVDYVPVDIYSGDSLLHDSQLNSSQINNFRLNESEQNENIFISYFHYLSQILTGHFGYSTVRGTSVFSEFFIYFPATLELSFGAIIFALGLGLPLGIFAAQNKNKWQDKLIVSTSLAGSSIPIFWWAMLLVLFFSLLLGITPVASRIGFEYDIIPVTGFMLIDTLLSKQPYSIDAFFSAIHHLILPAIVLGTIPLTAITRTTRSSMIRVLSEDYIRSAKTRGISVAQVIWKYALRNAMIPIITVLSLQISVLIAGSLLTETIFSWPGAGKWLLEAVNRRDFPVIHGGILAIASVIILSHLALDFASMLVDPKWRQR